MEDTDKAVDADGAEEADEKPRIAKSEPKTKKTIKNAKAAESTDDLKDKALPTRAPGGSAGGDDASAPSFGKQKDSTNVEVAEKTALSMLMYSAVTEEQKRAQVLEVEKLMEDIDLFNIGGAKQYQFRDTQPVPKMGELVEDVGSIEPDIPVSEICENLTHCPLDLSGTHLDDEDHRKELFQLLMNENHVEDDDFPFGLLAGIPIMGAIQPPGS